MIIKNDAKGSYGAFSKIGKATVNSFLNIKNQEQIINPKNNTDNKLLIIDFLKRNKYKNIEDDTSYEELKDSENFDEESETEEPIEEHDIFDINEDKKITNDQRNKKRKSLKFFHKTNIESYKYHDMNMKKKKKKKPFFTPNCTKYYPKKDYIWRKTPTCLKWDIMQKRKPLHVKFGQGDLLLHDHPLKDIKNCFVNMDKQTMRGDSIKFNNVRIQTARPFKTHINDMKDINKHNKSKNKRRKTRIETGIMRNYKNTLNLELTENSYHTNEYINEKEKINKRQITTELTDTTNNNIHTINTMSNNKSKTLFEEQKNYENMDESSSESNDSYRKYKPYYEKKLKYNMKTEVNELQNTNENEQTNFPNITKTENNDIKIMNIDNKKQKTWIDNKKIKGPVFDKIISREYYDNLKDNGITLIPFAVNNYKQVTERPLSMVKYNTKKVFKKKLDYFKGIEVGQFMNTPINYIEHKNYIPTFSKMHTRPDDKIPLPIHMKGIVSRNVCDMISDISLKMNSFDTGKSRGNYNTCNPKKSFNKIVNLNLMNDQELKKYIIMNNKDIFLDEDNRYIIKSIKFYKRNYKDLLKETTTKFDNITFKTIKSKYQYNLNT